MAESIVRLERRGGFTVLQNAMLRDKRLSLKTKGLFAVMLSRPDTWQFSVSGLAAFTGAGRDSIRGALKELREAGYLTLEKQAHGEGGKFAGSVYILHEISQTPCAENPATAEDSSPQPGFPFTAEPSTDKPSTGNPTQVKKDLSKERTINPPKAPQGGPDSAPKKKRRGAKSVPDWKPERFEGFWTFYPRHENRAAAAAEWDRLQPSDGLIDTIAWALQRQKATGDWARGIGIPHACRWLKNQRWTDGVAESRQPPAAAGRVVEPEDLPVW